MRGAAAGPPAADRPLAVAVVTRSRDALSLAHAREAIVRELAPLGCTPTAVPEGACPPSGADLLWDPGIAGTRGPRRLPNLPDGVPIVVTAHGAAAFVLAWREVWRNRAWALWGQLRKRRALRDWRGFNVRVNGVVVGVSDFGLREVGQVFGVPAGRLHRIYPGVSPATFRPDGAGPPTPGARPYFLTVAQYSPRKNLRALLAAYASLPRATRPDLVAVVPGWPGGPPGIEGVRLIPETLNHADLARWYRGARALVFPSLHETFGHPILEAMACGCPVITSDVSACPEIAGDAALLVDPRSVSAIAGAMDRVQDATLHGSLRERGFVRARQFTWRMTAERYVALFRAVLGRLAPAVASAPRRPRAVRQPPRSSVAEDAG
jgi:glycosyltransferase involved in cell wall biosynthesis